MTKMQLQKSENAPSPESSSNSGRRARVWLQSTMFSNPQYSTLKRADWDLRKIKHEHYENRDYDLENHEWGKCPRRVSFPWNMLTAVVSEIDAALSQVPHCLPDILTIVPIVQVEQRRLCTTLKHGWAFVPRSEESFVFVLPIENFIAEIHQCIGKTNQWTQIQKW